MSRRAPRPVHLSIAALVADLAPATTLAGVQSVWREVVGDTVADAASPTAEHDGVLTVGCTQSVWAAELDLMGPELVERLNARLGNEALRSLRCRATPPPQTL